MDALLWLVISKCDKQVCEYYKCEEKSSKQSKVRIKTKRRANEDIEYRWKIQLDNLLFNLTVVEG